MEINADLNRPDHQSYRRRKLSSTRRNIKTESAADEEKNNVYGFDPPNEATSKRAADAKIQFIKPRKVYNNFTSQNSDGRTNRGDSDRKVGVSDIQSEQEVK